MENRFERLQQLLIRWGLVLVPTVLIGFITLRFLNFSYTSLNTGLGSQTFYFALGLVISYSLYYFRARWIVTFIVLWLVYLLFEKVINHLPGEFDVFYATARFQLFSTLFLFGWGFGFLLIKLRWSYILIFGVLFIATLVPISDTIDITLTYILSHIAPVVIYGLYMYFLSPQLTDKIELNAKRSTRFVLRVVLFALLVLLAFVLSQSLFKGDMKAVEKELAARGAKGDKDGKGDGSDYDDRYGLMEKKGDDGYRLKDTMRVNTKMSSSDKLMFCAKLDNFGPDGSPIPHYFVYHYLTKYDPVKESFTRDINVPSFDEIDVDPTELPLYYSYTDTSIIRKSKGNRFKKIVEAQVYLSENTWKHSVLGPANVFSLQTIPVEKDFQKQFLSAYKIYAYVSELNNAYFVYNVSASPQLADIQFQREEELRSVNSYKNVDKKFMDYYLQQPNGGIYDSIYNLAHSLVDIDAKPIDKVLAVRDFFLRRNENGKRIFRYTLKAGAVDDPNIPSSKMLYNFLFKTHAGYCTYYAGASLFMLRALGVPTRFTTGFATVNRSDKNKGWYWFYASQAHAWTQVYFPGYGWLDFDMTIGNEGQQEAPKPDGTPPLPPPEPWLVLNAKAEAVDVGGKKLDASFRELIFHKRPYRLKQPITRAIDASLCRVVYGEKDTTLSVIQPGDSVIVVSYNDEAKKVPQPRNGVAIEQQISGFPSPIIADEIHVRPREKEKKPEEGGGRPTKTEEKKMSWQEIAWIVAKVAGGLVLLIMLLPTLYLLYRVLAVAMAGDPKSKANQVYRAALYRFHMAGLERGTETPLEYAQITVDTRLQAGFEVFMRTYLSLKYSNRNLTPEDVDVVNRFQKQVGAAIRKNIGFGRVTLNYLNLLLAIRYFQTPVQPENENSI